VNRYAFSVPDNLIARDSSLDPLHHRGPLELGHVAEGVYSAPAVEALAEGKKIDMPITKAVCSVLFRGLAPREAAQQLLARDPKTED